LRLLIIIVHKTHVYVCYYFTIYSAILATYFSKNAVIIFIRIRKVWPPLLSLTWKLKTRHHQQRIICDYV